MNIFEVRHFYSNFLIRSLQYNSKKFASENPSSQTLVTSSILHFIKVKMKSNKIKDHKMKSTLLATSNKINFHVFSLSQKGNNKGDVATEMYRINREHYMYLCHEARNQQRFLYGFVTFVLPSTYEVVSFGRYIKQ